MEGAQALALGGGADAAPATRRRGRRAAQVAASGEQQLPSSSSSSSRLRWLKPRLRRRSTDAATAAADALALPQQQQQQQQQQRRRGRRRGAGSNGGGAAPQPPPLEEQQQQQAAASNLRAPLPAATPSSSFPPLLKPAAVPASAPSLPAAAPTAPAAPPAAALPAPPSPPPFSPSLPPLLEQLAFGAVGALTTAVLSGVAALQAQQQVLDGHSNGGGSQEGEQKEAAPGDRASALALPPPPPTPLLRTAGITASAGLGGFPLVLQPAPVLSGRAQDGDEQGDQQQQLQPLAPQRLLAAGTRTWGSGAWWDGRSLMRVRIYDFALYVDASAAARAKQALLMAASPTATAATPSSSSLADALALSATDVPATILLRAARDVPLSRLADEYERILRRRVAAALAAEGRSAADQQADDEEPALRALLDAFRDPSRLPRAALSLPSSSSSNGEPAVARGASLTFERLPGGRVLARCITPAEGQGVDGAGADAPAPLSSSASDVVTTLADVTSPTLCRALFGLYLADQPVSAKAKAAAADSLARLLLEEESEGEGRRRRGRTAAENAAYRPRRGDRVVCDLEVAPLEEHDACVLVPAYD